MSFQQGWKRFLVQVTLLAALSRHIHGFCRCAPTPTKQRVTPTTSTCVFVKEPSTRVDIGIRDCLYGEIGDIADVIMESFYVDAKPPWNHMYRLGEINRLQQGFPYADRDKHRMLVAVAKEMESIGEQVVMQERIVGYCDCDLRIPNQSTYQYNPRPYVSDLCVSPSIRRQGIANKLVQFCEEFCQEIGKTEVFIRVERKNLAALTLYQNLGYVEIENNLDDTENVVVLRKPL